MIIFTLNATRRQRLVSWVIAPVLVTVAIIALPNTVVTRIMSFSDANKQASQEALESSAARQELLKESVLCTFRNPVFGIGPGQFTTYQGTKEELRGTGLYWHNAHNSYTQVASECGMPGLIFYLGGVFSTLALLNKAHRRTRCDPRLAGLRNALFCIRLAMVGFCTAIFFLNFAYMFYLPAMAGLAIAISRCTPEPAAARSVFDKPYVGRESATN
jgi:O-antigen ligase